MTERQVVVYLTMPQAEALAHAASNSLDAWDDALAVTGHPKKAEAGQRGLDRLWAAIHRCEVGEPTRGPIVAAATTSRRNR
jgi:hypothetical protein